MRSRISLTVATLGALSILIALGVWQLQRREWKNDLIARFAAALSKPPAAYSPPEAGHEAGREFMRVRVRGEFLGSGTVKLLIQTPEAAGARTRDSFGYLLFTPLKFEGGIVYVNRGFMPQSLEGAAAPLPPGETEVTGIVRLAARPGWFTPAPDPAKRLFFDADIAAMAAAAGIKPGEAIAGEYIEAEPVPGAGGWPLARAPRSLLTSIPNWHLEYALTWFGLAAALLGVYGVLMVRN